MNYGMGQAGRYIGGADFQTGFDPRGGFTPGTAGTGKFSKYFSKPTGDGGIKNLFDNSTPIKPIESVPEIGKKETLQEIVDKAAIENLPLEKQISEKAQAAFIKNTQAPNLSLLDRAKDFAMNNKLATFLLAKEGVDLLSSGPEEVVSEIMDRGEGLDLDSIRLEVREAFKDSSGQKLAALRNKYPYLGTQASKNTEDMAMGGRIGFAEGGGIMDLGGMEKDYRAEGGFVPIGKAEKADDVPARLSVNEFVMTADAVRGMGDGDIDLGAKRMENLMGSMENKKGAQQMFDVSERLSEVV
jgi:hypothetical protein